VGERTGGDGYVRTLFDLPDRLGALVVPTGVLERADGRTIQRPMRPAFALIADRRSPAPPTDAAGDWGVQPDHAVHIADEARAAWLRWRQEEDLPITDPASARDTAPASDPQLDEARELLRRALQDSAAG
jgi:hypothetical protein